MDEDGAEVSCVLIVEDDDDGMGACGSGAAMDDGSDVRDAIGIDWLDGTDKDGGREGIPAAALGLVESLAVVEPTNGGVYWA